MNSSILPPNYLQSIEYFPKSVIQMSKSKRVQDLRSNRIRNEKNNEYAYNSSRNTKSNFSLDIANFILKYYNRDKLKTYDPFSGWGERGLACSNLDIDYVGVDISSKAIQYANDTYNIDNLKLNSQKIPFDSCNFGFSYTCPPYFNLEKYESIEGQLTDITNYIEFLNKISKNYKETYRVLKYNSFFVIVVGDFRIKRKFYDYSTDTINILKNIGFYLYDKIILDKSANYLLPMFLPQAYSLNYVVKIHEYILVFKKEV